jgi:MFS family permease
MEGRPARTRDAFWRERDRRRGRDERARRRARWVGAVGFVLAAALPALLFHDVVVDIASQFRLDAHYFIAEWLPWVLIALGLGFLAPVAWSAGRDSESRWYPRARNAYAGWGVSLYLLGVALAVQVAQIADGLSP